MSANAEGNRELLKLLGDEKFKKKISMTSKDEFPGGSRMGRLEESCRSFTIRQGGGTAGFLRLLLHFSFSSPCLWGDPCDGGAIVPSARW